MLFSAHQQPAIASPDTSSTQSANALPFSAQSHAPPAPQQATRDVSLARTTLSSAEAPATATQDSTWTLMETVKDVRTLVSPAAEVSLRTVSPARATLCSSTESAAAPQDSTPTVSATASLAHSPAAPVQDQPPTTVSAARPTPVHNPMDHAPATQDTLQTETATVSSSDATTLATPASPQHRQAAPAARPMLCSVKANAFVQRDTPCPHQAPAPSLSATQVASPAPTR